MTGPLSQRMREAADALQEFNTENDLYTPDAPWRPSELRREAGHREAEEREAAEKSTTAELLAQECRANEKVSGWDAFAGVLVESGWRKGETA